MQNSITMALYIMTFICAVTMIRGLKMDSETWSGNNDDCPGSCTCTPGTITCTNLKALPQILPGTNRVILTKCRIPILEDNIFKNMTNIRSLTMRHLNMDQDVFIKPKAFIGLDNLQELELTSTRLRILSGIFNSFDPLFNLKSLNLSGAGLGSNDAEEILKNITQLKTLDLSHSYIDVLTVDLSDNFKHLKHVNLAVNAFTTIEDAVNVFNKSTDLQYLDLSDAMFRVSGTPAITELGTVFLTFTKPLTLKLKNVEIPKIGGTFFDNAQTISELHIKDSDIIDISENALTNLTRLKIFDVSANPLLPMKNLFTSLKDVNISELYFQENKIDTEINTDLVSLLGNTSLEILDLSHGQIEKIGPLAFTPLTRLKKLDLSYNKIMSLKNMGEFLKLKTFDLQHNRLISFETNTISQLYFLEHLYLNDNLLEDMEEYMLNNMGKLEVLDLSNNNINVLHDHFLLTTLSLKTLKLSQALRSTQQSNWHKLLKGLWKLETLLMQNNGITVLQENTFQYNRILREVDISGNKLEVLPVGLFNTPKSTLQSVDANNNLIKTIDVKVFNQLNNLTFLDISMNPLDCGCDLAEFAIWTVNNSVVFNSNQTKCSTPEQLQNTTVTTYASEIPIDCFVIHKQDLPVGFVVLVVLFILIGIPSVALLSYFVHKRFKKTLSESRIRYMELR